MVSDDCPAKERLDLGCHRQDDRLVAERVPDRGTHARFRSARRSVPGRRWRWSSLRLSDRSPIVHPDDPVAGPE
jgi:hypothetical protein